MISASTYQELLKGKDLSIPIQEEVGIFSREDENLLVFATPVLDQVSYIPPSLGKYIARTLKDEHMQKKHLFVIFDEDQQTFFLEGIWDLGSLDTDKFNYLINDIRELAYEVKQDIYKTLCIDLVYAVAKKSIE